jgi:LmbE family N-acetylglucosaminyl deacetylase
MVELRLGSARQPLRRILCLGSHCDDIEIGCGGTILRLLRAHPGIEIHWNVFSSTPIRKREALRAASLFLTDAKGKKVSIKKFRDSFFPSLHTRIKVEFEKLKKEANPDLILTHYRHDLHQDHRIINELTWNTFRNHLILEYEIPKYDGDLGKPNCFVALERSICDRKAKYILDSFASQRKKQWFTADTFLALQRIRGIESAAPGGYAEGFHCRKLVL